ncbi:MAG: hypothetical protein JXA44_04560 [Methanospirillaceae archaeon]|nr:hypothetical protein [Methanospirillaceae archaeon]
MKKNQVYGLIVMLLFSVFCTGLADEVVVLPGDAENPWNGTWISQFYTLSIQQNGSEIAGSYVPFDLDTYDAGLLTGSLSDDTRTFFGVWTESGFVNGTLSEDKNSFAGVISNNPAGDMNDPYAYPKTVTRTGNGFDPDNPWSGTWESKRKSYVLVQSGTIVTGTHEPLPGIEDEPGIFEGTVSDDKRSASLKWLESGSFSFTLSDDGSYYNGTFTVDRDPDTESNYWNATRIG